MSTNQRLELSQSRLLEVLIYDADTGEFRWRASRRGVKAGAVAGCADVDGYRRIRVDWRIYRAHRLAWLYTRGCWPPAGIDHINGIRDDNRLSNLREATAAENGQNQRKAQRNNQCGLLGVTFDKGRGQWKAQIQIAGRGRHIGYFDAAEEAHTAYLAAKAALHPFNTIAETA